MVRSVHASLLAPLLVECTGHGALTYPPAVVAGLAALPSALGHGLMVQPVSRATRGVRQNVAGDPSAVNRWSTGCPGWGCFFYVGGTMINCPEPNPTRKQATQSPYGVGPSPCEGNENDVEPTLFGPELRTYDVDGSHGWYKYQPWRYPGKAPVIADDGCGTGGGGNMGFSVCQGDPQGAKAGDKGSDLPPLSVKTLWTAGEQVEVAFGIFANHGGGYQYRICPKNESGNHVSEACFQQTPLKFVDDKSYLVKWNDPSVREEFTATRVSNGTWPEGSTWSKNPIAACVAASNGLRPFNPPEGESGGSADTGCKGPHFPPIPSKIWNVTYGWGDSACAVGCKGDDFDKWALNFYIADKVQIPADLPPGDYVVGWRWDCEQTPQIWHSCADVTVQPAGSPQSDPYPPIDGCDVCNVAGGPCAHCKACLNDKTGDCKKCWKKHTSCKTSPSLRYLPACLGEESPFFNCTQCWTEPVRTEVL